MAEKLGNSPANFFSLVVLEYFCIDQKLFKEMRNIHCIGERKSTSSILALLSALLSITIVLTGCSPERETQFTVTTSPTMIRTPTINTAPTVTQISMPSPVVESRVDPLVIALTRSKWQQVRRPDPTLAAETVTWEFYANGTFRWQFTSDYSETSTGAWAISSVSERSGVLFLASTRNDLPAFDVLSLQLQNGVLMLGEFSYEGIPFTNTEAPPEIHDENHQAVANQREDIFSFWMTLTVTDWQSEAASAPGDPDSYSLMRDGTYTARFDATQCDYAGTWSTSFSGEDSGLIRFSVPANACDPRGPQEAFVREIPTQLDGEKLILSETVYVPVPK